MFDGVHLCGVICCVDVGFEQSSSHEDRCNGDGYPPWGSCQYVDVL